jgi:hypothetical protein
MWEDVLDVDRPQMAIRRMCILCWISKVQTHTKICDIYCFIATIMVELMRLNVTCILYTVYVHWLFYFTNYNHV